MKTEIKNVDFDHFDLKVAGLIFKMIGFEYSQTANLGRCQPVKKGLNIGLPQNKTEANFVSITTDADWQIYGDIENVSYTFDFYKKTGDGVKVVATVENVAHTEIKETFRAHTGL